MICIPAYGVRGTLTYRDNRVQCHICGKWFIFLGGHVAKTHEMSCDDYRREFGLPRRGAGLVSEQLHDWMQFNHGPRIVADLKEWRAEGNSPRPKGTRIAPRETRICPSCGRPFEVTVRSNRATCSRKCGHKATARWHTGRQASEETRKKCSVAQKARVTSEVARHISHSRDLHNSLLYRVGRELTGQTTVDEVATQQSISRKHASVILCELYKRGVLQRVAPLTYMRA